MKHLVLLLLLAACGDDGDGGARSADAGHDSGPRPTPPADACVQPGDMGNETGVGTYCSPGGHECGAFALAPLCLADAAPDEGEWFCTRLCDAETDCGADAFCLMAEGGAACVPNRCSDGPPDAGPADAATPGRDGGRADGGGADGG